MVSVYTVPWQPTQSYHSQENVGKICVCWVRTSERPWLPTKYSNRELKRGPGRWKWGGPTDKETNIFIKTVQEISKLGSLWASAPRIPQSASSKVVKFGGPQFKATHIGTHHVPQFFATYYRSVSSVTCRGGSGRGPR